MVYMNDKIEIISFQAFDVIVTALCPVNKQLISMKNSLVLSHVAEQLSPSSQKSSVLDYTDGIMLIHTTLYAMQSDLHR